MMGLQTYAWEWGHPQFDPDTYKSWRDFEKRNPYVKPGYPVGSSTRRVPGTDASEQAVSESDYPNYPY